MDMISPYYALFPHPQSLAPDANLRLSMMEEKRLLEPLKNIQSLQDLKHMHQRLVEQLGIRLPRWKHADCQACAGLMVMQENRGQPKVASCLRP